jgi:putative transposase
MGLRLPNQHFASCFFVTTSFSQHQRLGDIPGFYDKLTESICFCLRKYDAQMAAYVLMPTHIHLLMFIDGKHLGGFMRDLKKYVAQKVAPDIGVQAMPLWQARYDRVAILSDEVFQVKMDYIHNNPIKAGLSTRQEDWRWSSASDYLTDTAGPIPVHKGWV